MNPKTQARGAAMDFMYELSEPTVQQELFEQAGMLPPSGGLLDSLADGESILGRAIRQASADGQLAAPTPPD